MKRLALLPLGLALASAAPGCGSGHKASPAPTTTAAASTTAAATTTTTQGPGALQAEATSAAAGDIPDNQVFLVFRNGAAGYSIKYPEGWAQQGSGKTVVFRDKNNIVRIVAAQGSRPTVAEVRAQVRALPGVKLQGSPSASTLGGAPGLKVAYSTQSAPNPVTGKRVKLVVDRYYVWKNGKLAVVDLGTPEGVDNVDAYRLMIESFRWR
jgi:hypothetical protein